MKIFDVVESDFGEARRLVDPAVDAILQPPRPQRRVVAARLRLLPYAGGGAVRHLRPRRHLGALPHDVVHVLHRSTAVATGLACVDKDPSPAQRRARSPGSGCPSPRGC